MVPGLLSQIAQFCCHPCLLETYIILESEIVFLWNSSLRFYYAPAYSSLSKNQPSIQGSVKHLYSDPFKTYRLSGINPSPQSSWHAHQMPGNRMKPSGEGYIVTITHPNLPSHQQHSHLPYPCNQPGNPKEKGEK